MSTVVPFAKFDLAHSFAPGSSDRFRRVLLLLIDSLADQHWDPDHWPLPEAPESPEETGRFGEQAFTPKCVEALLELGLTGQVSFTKQRHAGVDVVVAQLFVENELASTPVEHRMFIGISASSDTTESAHNVLRAAVASIIR